MIADFTMTNEEIGNVIRVYFDENKNIHSLIGINNSSDFYGKFKDAPSIFKFLDYVQTCLNTFPEHLKKDITPTKVVEMAILEFVKMWSGVWMLRLITSLDTSNVFY